MTQTQETLTDRQKREIYYHRDFAAGEHACRDIAFDILRAHRRSWFNASWAMYSEMLKSNPGDKKVLVVGCGFGEDAIRLASCGANVCAFDISPDVLSVAENLANKYSQTVEFAQMSAEKLSYKDSTFDWVVIRDILHHVEIPLAMSEISRVCRSGAALFANEVYSHSFTDIVRHNRIVDSYIYPRLRKTIYQGKTPYITADERKCNQRDIAEVKKHLDSCRTKYFSFMCGRLISPANITAAKIDRTFLKTVGPLGKFLAGRIVIKGKLK